MHNAYEAFIILLKLQKSCLNISLIQRVLKHPAGEVWGLNPNPSNSSLFVSTFGEKTETSWRKKAAVMKIPEGKVRIVKMF